MENGKVGNRIMPSFNNTFMTFANGSCDPNKWKEYFLDYEPEVWDSEGDGVLQFRSDDNKEYSLVISHWSNLGFLLQLTCDNLETKNPEYCLFSLSDISKINDFAELDDLKYPVGCFLSSENTWLAVEDFLNNPEQPSSRIQWIEDSEIEWPESVY
ncbi:hypothetical protein [uncultured Gimesia sp.]|uniref:hypothetical protein n=1 Tax=uncultured Gimesia sp. TaxID=1678688 RepID=UPI0030DD4415|tara:strand:+ start:697 stop:1164 length:468 start_codon:yes stop_codon:yes gene_type:complete